MDVSDSLQQDIQENLRFTPGTLVVMTKIVADEVENSMNILHLPAVQGSFGGHVESPKTVFQRPMFPGPRQTTHQQPSCGCVWGAHGE